MTDELRRSMAALERSREDLRDSLERIGDTLTSTHDLDGLLQVVLETAVVTLQGRSGVVLRMSTDRLQLVAQHGLDEAGLPAPAVVTPGTGVLGKVVSTGEGVRGRLGSGPAELEPVAGEPGAGEVLAVPVRSMGNVVGVVALYDRIDGRAFDPADEDALRTLAGQASIAVDNVHLHHEAQRLSTTDPLTGLWNFRYLSMSLAREIERSTRFDRPLAVLMLDLDHFKLVNDTHGHAARRLGAARAGAPGAGADPRGRHLRALRRRGVRRRPPGDHASRARPSWPSGSASRCAASRSGRRARSRSTSPCRSAEPPSRTTAPAPRR